MLLEIDVEQVELTEVCARQDTLAEVVTNLMEICDKPSIIIDESHNRGISDCTTPPPNDRSGTLDSTSIVVQAPGEVILDHGDHDATFGDVFCLHSPPIGKAAFGFPRDVLQKVPTSPHKTRGKSPQSRRVSWSPSKSNSMDLEGYPTTQFTITNLVSHFC